MTRGVEQLRDWSRRFAAVDPIAADVAELLDQLEAVTRRAAAAEGDWHAFEALAGSRLQEIEWLRDTLTLRQHNERVRDTAAQLWNALDRARAGGETFSLEIIAAGALLHEALEAPAVSGGKQGAAQ